MATQLGSIKRVRRFPGFVVDGFNYQSPDVVAYFLTHFHADHTCGLHAGFKGPAPIYCTAVTAALLTNVMGVKPSLVRAVPVNDTVQVRTADGAVAFPKVGKVDEPLVEEVAALVEYALKPGADRLDVLVASEASHAANAAAAAQLLKCACAAISSNEDPAALVFVEPTSTTSRPLAATDAPTASSSTEYYSLEEIRNYQICLWTAIALISVLLSAVLFLACMRPEYDSLLYATFQANVGDHFGKEN